ncbi:uncharacterized protein LOC107273355 isoform X3 [Cephus cinctus]|nr:uncharacterized protein LOC107273355 isoform X3 [Cephus cinctus]
MGNCHRTPKKRFACSNTPTVLLSLEQLIHNCIIMETSDGNLPYILQGCIFYLLGLNWCYEHAKQQVIPKQERKGSRKNCSQFVTNHSAEGILQ